MMTWFWGDNIHQLRFQKYIHGGSGVDRCRWMYECYRLPEKEEVFPLFFIIKNIGQ
jgi:hypothetical protein